MLTNWEGVRPKGVLPLPGVLKGLDYLLTHSLFYGQGPELGRNLSQGTQHQSSGDNSSCQASFYLASELGYTDPNAG